MRTPCDFVTADCPQDDERSASRCSPAALESTPASTRSQRSRCVPWCGGRGPGIARVHAQRALIAPAAWG